MVFDARKIGRPKRTEIHTNITTAIPVKDYEYVKEKGLTFKALLMNAINEHRVATHDKDAIPSMRGIQAAKKRIEEHRDKLLTAIRRKLGEDEFIKFLSEEL